VLIETTAGAISIGAELPQYLGVARHLAPRTYPTMTGYESLGRVLAVGAAVVRPQPGQRVFAFYGHRTHAVVPAAKAIAVPDDIADAVALLAILSCDVMKGVRKLAPRPGETALVTGAGVIGSLSAWTLARLGVPVDVVEPNAARRALAEQLGARRAVAAPNELDDAYTLGVECSSRDAAFGLLQTQMARDGRICVLSDGNLEPLTLTPHFHARELSIVGSSDGWDYHAHAAWFWPHARRDADALSALYGWRVQADELPAAFERLATEVERPVKVLVGY
jgi:alcohol dehydrogenase